MSSSWKNMANYVLIKVLSTSAPFWAAFVLGLQISFAAWTNTFLNYFLRSSGFWVVIFAQPALRLYKFIKFLS